MRGARLWVHQYTTVCMHDVACVWIHLGVYWNNLDVSYSILIVSSLFFKTASLYLFIYLQIYSLRNSQPHHCFSVPMTSVRHAPSTVVITSMWVLLLLPNEVSTHSSLRLPACAWLPGNTALPSFGPSGGVWCLLCPHVPPKGTCAMMSLPSACPPITLWPAST